MRIFNRERDSRHALHTALEEMRKSKDDGDRAMASNFLHDPRVSDARERSFVRFVGRCVSMDEFEDRRGRYARERISLRHDPEFGWRGNAQNLIRKRPVKLVSVFRLNGLWPMFYWAKEDGKHEVPFTATATAARRAVDYFERFLPAVLNGEDARAVRWVDEMMSDPVRRHRLIGMIRELHAIYRRSHPYHPIWLTTRAALRPCERFSGAKRAARWVHRVGVSSFGKDRQWAMLVGFSSSKLTQLYRPTVLDCATKYHVPTPEGIPAANGGRAADLRMEGITPAVEYIAHWPSFKEAAIDLKRDCKCLKAVREGSIPKVRRHHIAQLRRMFRGTKSRAWLDRVEVSAV